MIGPVQIDTGSIRYEMFVDDGDTLGLANNHIYEPSLTAFFARTIKRGDVCVDVGAMVGYYTMMFAALTGDDGVVTSFEPDAVNFSILEANIDLNEYGGIVLPVQKAVSRTTGEGSLYHCVVHDGGHTIFPLEDCPGEPVKIQTVGLDDYYSNGVVKVDVIKMDIQGSEIMALNGMMNLLTINHDIVLTVEYEPWLIQQAGEDPRSLLGILSLLGFRLFSPTENELTADEIYNGIPRDKGHHTNLICRR